MKKIVILLSLIIIVSIVCLIPVSRQKTVSVKASFFNVYKELASADAWKKWRPDIRSEYLKDSSKISDKKGPNGFDLHCGDTRLGVSIVNGYSFDVDERKAKTELAYSYTVVPQKIQDVTMIILTEKTNLLKYLVNLAANQSFSETHVDDFKNFMEDPDLYYGYKIIKTRVVDTNIIVLKKVVPGNDKFVEAAKTLTTLKQYIASRGLRQTQPLMAQFFPGSKDSVKVNVGLPINKKVPASGPVNFMSMPQTGYMYTLRFHGKFRDRVKAYAAVQQYFSDRQMAMPILPFETYLDNKLPQSDSDIVNIQINCSTF